tara:strand:- start:1919 stop:2104 length:186 start_codon:yes stop_codon:yes gene_type:complete
MKIKVYIAVYENDHGIDVFAADSEQELDRLCADYDNEPDDGNGYSYCTRLEREIKITKPWC